MMQCDLERLYGELASQIPTSKNENFLFSQRNLPIVPELLSTEKLCIQKGIHYYGSSLRVDLLHCFASKQTYKLLGLLILSVILCPEPAAVQLQLTHPESHIKHLIVEFQYPSLDELHHGYHTHPYAFKYEPGKTHKHPWYRLHIEPIDLPYVSLTNLDDDVSSSEEDWNKRDTVKGFGSDKGSILFAELLLNLSRPQETRDEYELEGEVGFRGVAPGSAELRLWLPGSFGWEPEMG